MAQHSGVPVTDPAVQPSEPILIRLGYDIQFEMPAPVTMVALLNVHPSRDRALT